MTTACPDDPDYPPLWEQMLEAVIAVPAPRWSVPGKIVAAQIRAVRDWLESIEDAPGRFVNGCCLEDRQRLRALLTAEAERAERGT